MADHEEQVEANSVELERKLDRQLSSRPREQRAPRTKDKLAESHRLPTPPPDPWTTRGCARGARSPSDIARPRSLDEEEDIIAYLTDLGCTPAFEGQASECPSRNSATSTMPVASLCTDEAFEHLDRLYDLTEQILELRSRSASFFKRVRNLERFKVLQSADRRLESAFARDKDLVVDFYEEDTGFAESLLDAMLSNCRDPQIQRRNVRSPASRGRSRSLAQSEQSLPRLSSPVERFENEKDVSSRNPVSTSTPKVSKWTRVKAAFKWEKACTNDAVENVDSTTTTPSTPTTKYLRIPEAGVGNWSGSTLSSTSEVSGPSTPFGRVSSASSSNEGSYDGPRKNLANHSDRQSSKTKEERKEGASRRCRSLDGDIIMMDVLVDAEQANEASHGKPLIRITSENNSAIQASNIVDKKDGEASSKRLTPTLTITIPPNEEEIRTVSTPESISPLLSSSQNSGGNSPLHPKSRQEITTKREFKRQRSTMEEPVSPAPKMQRQDSKWNKVRRAFLTNSITSSVPPSPVRIISGQMFLQDGSETPKANSCSGSVEDIDKNPTTNAQAETRRDYQALREKLGAEFHRKLIEWERLKNMSPRVTVRNTRESLSGSSLTAREALLSEESLAPEFKKKLQDWKRAKKGRRGSATFEQQRVSRRRLTDWQLWRSPSKPETRHQDTIGSRGSCASAGSVGSNFSDARPHLCEDFVRRMEAWRRMNEATHRGAEASKRGNSRRLGFVSPGIDESEFIALEKVLLIFGDKIGRERRESDARQLDECFNGETRFIDGAQSSNSGNEVLIRTSVGSYRFEGISREFTRKLYDWEKYRGISPRSSTFRLLGPAYTPFAGETDAEESSGAASKSNTAENQKVFLGTLRRSKSVGSVVDGCLRNDPFARRSASLQSLKHLTKRLEENDRNDTSPAPINSPRTEDASEEVVDDSEPEAMIVDIEDVVEETASPLKRVQPHQTPVYSVAASETTSIAVPLGTVTSSHEPSPVFLVEIEGSPSRKHWDARTWNQRKNFSSEDSPSPEHFDPLPRGDVDSEHWLEPWSRRDCCSFERYELRDWNCLDRDSLRSERSLCSLEWSRKNDAEARDRCYSDFQREEIPVLSSDGENAGEHVHADKDQSNIVQMIAGLGNLSTLSEDTKESMDLSSEKKLGFKDQEEINDGCSNDEEETIQPQKTIENEYEQIIPATGIYSCAITSQPMPKYIDSIKTFLTSSTNFEDKRSTGVDFCRANGKEKEASDGSDENYGIIRDDLQSRRYHELCKSKPDSRNYEERRSNVSEESSSSRYDEDNRVKETLMFRNSTDNTKKDVRRYSRDYENISTIVHTMKPSSSIENHREPTIPTTSLSMAATSSREECCYERIIINEQTINKIVVPTASTGETSINSRDSIDSSKDSLVEQDQREILEKSASKKTTDSPTRNVFVKTKRMIFSPFRRTEDRSIRRQTDEASDEDRGLRPKSKSKSRSSSPKMHRQDALLRMPLSLSSLSWPLRPSSKDRDAKVEPKIESNRMKIVNEEKSRKSTAERRSSKISTESLPGVNKIPLSRSSKSPKLEENRLKNCSANRVDISVQATPRIEQSHRTFFGVHSSSSVDRKSEDIETSSRTDPLSSDLIHKLEILSSVAARRDGRDDRISVYSYSPESHSSRTRRAKESFLSHRGGPLCRSVSEPRATDTPSNDFKVEIDHYEKVDEDPGKNASTDEVEVSKTTENGEEILKIDEDAGATSVRINVDEKNDQRAEASSRLDLVKSASVGMINVDPDTFGRLATEPNRGCESLPRMISKRREPSGPFARIVNKFKLSRLIRGKDPIIEGNMSTISRLCRQSLLIDVRSDFEEHRDPENQRKQEKLPRVESDEKMWDEKK